MTYSDESVYKGDWKADKRHGQGSLSWVDGSKYEGTWNNDEKTGYG